MNYILKGIPASGGFACGRVRVLHNSDNNPVLEAGSVLVTQFPTPSLTTLLSRAAALVCAHGGTLSLLVTTAREWHIPAVVGLSDLIQSLKDGDMVCVNGTAGLV